MPAIDSYSISEVTIALQAMRMSPKARTLVHALASAPNRAMSRLELSRSIGSDSVNSCNTVLGRFARDLCLTIDPSLASKTGGDWVMFINSGPRRWTPPTVGDNDEWVFVMAETLARALDALGFSAYRKLDADAAAAVAKWRDAVGEAYDTDTQASDPVSEIEAAKEQLDALSPTERESVITARIGRGVFRSRLLTSWNAKCAVTGCSVEEALIASHIKPWIVSSNDERLNPNNGLLLIGNLDRLFDSGLITFSPDGLIQISESIPEEECDALGLSRSLHLRHVPPAAQPFLDFHRQECFRLSLVE